MIDGIKSWDVVSSIDNDQLKVNGLRFRRNQYNNHCVTGSIHKFHNDGIHNSDDFTLSKVKMTFNDMYDNFGINPAITRLNYFEFGVNLHLNQHQNINPEIAIQSILLFRNKIGKRSNHYIDFPLEDYRLKVYSKSAIGNTNIFQKEKILRVEIHANKMRFFKRNNMVLKMFSDLLNDEVFVKLEQVLIRAIKDCIIVYLSKEDFQKLSDEQITYYYKYTNPNYWLSKKGTNKNRELKRLEKFIIEHSSVDLKQLLIQIIQEKCSELRDVETANEIKTSWNQNTNIAIITPTKKHNYITTSNNLKETSKWKENTIKINDVFVPPSNKYYIYCKGCGKKIYNPRKGQVYCSAADVGKAAAQRCRDRVDKPLKRIIKLYLKISDSQVLFDSTPFIDPEYKQLLERQHII